MNSCKFLFTCVIIIITVLSFNLFCGTTLELNPLDKNELKDNNHNGTIEIELDKLPSESKQPHNKLDDMPFDKSVEFIATAYHIDSCGKKKTHKAYGITANGTNVKKVHTWRQRFIAVDPRKIAMNSKVYVEFPNEYSHMNGIYTAVDTGGKIRGKHIDVFFGKQKVNAIEFGVQKVKIYR